MKWKNVFQIVLIAIIYSLTAKLGLKLGAVEQIATLVWPPTGIALAVLLIFGYRLWPAITLGAFLVNFWVTGRLIVAIPIAIGNTLEALVGVYLLKRIIFFNNSLERRQDVLALIFLAAMMSTAISALIGISAGWYGGVVSKDQIGRAWTVWWLGDIIADLTIAPLLLAWSAPVKFKRKLSVYIEFMVLIITVITVSLMIFIRWPNFAFSEYLQPYLVFPLLVWAAYRFTQHGTVSILFIIYVISIIGTYFDLGPFKSQTLTESLLRMQVFIIITATSTLLLSAAITERKLIENRLRHTQDELEIKVEERTKDLIQKDVQLVEAQRIAHVGSWEWNIKQNSVNLSDELYSIYGLKPGAFSFTYEQFLERCHPFDRSMVDEVIHKSLTHRQPFSFEHRIVRPSRSIRVLLSCGKVIVDEFGNPARIIGTGLDITERKQVEEERAILHLREQRAREEAENANKAKDLFLAILSHELRTPLTTILTWAQLLRMGKIHSIEKMKLGFKAIEESARAQQRLIDDLLDVSRIISGKFSLEKNDSDPVEVVRRAIDAVKPMIEAKSIRLECQFDPLLKLIYADPIRLQQLIWNLLSNAIKFTPPGGLIDFKVYDEEKFVCFVVRDTGKGLRREFIPYIFERFSQADLSSVREYGGLGLGLAIVRNIVDLHGGTIKAESEGEGKGSTFTVKIPKTIHIPALSTETTPESLALTEKLDEAHISLAGLRILLVDDDLGILESTLVFLQSFGAQVKGVTSSAEALGAQASFKPNVILSDIAMPGEDGYSLLRKLKALWVERHEKQIPLVALTAYAGIDEIHKVYSSGFSAYLSKPIDAQKLLKTLVKVAA